MFWQQCCWIPTISDCVVHQLKFQIRITDIHVAGSKYLLITGGCVSALKPCVF